MEPYGIPTDQYDDLHEERPRPRAPGQQGRPGTVAARPATDLTTPSRRRRRRSSRSAASATPPPRTSTWRAATRSCEAAAPKCWTCHGTHDVSKPSSRALLPPDAARLRLRHLPRPADTTRCASSSSQFDDPANRRCDTCHHPDSQIYSQIEGISGARDGRRGGLRRRGGRDPARRRAGHDHLRCRGRAGRGQDEPDPGPGGGPHDQAHVDRRAVGRCGDQGRDGEGARDRRRSTRPTSGARPW